MLECLRTLMNVGFEKYKPTGEGAASGMTWHDIRAEPQAPEGINLTLVNLQEAAEGVRSHQNIMRSSLVHFSL